MADQPSSFSDWIAKQGGSSFSPRKVDVSKLAGATNGRSAQAQEGNAQDPLSWLIDIISRPLYGVTNSLQDTVNRSAEATIKAQEGDVAGALGAQVSNNPFAWLGGFAEGLTSTDPMKKRLFSDVIEQSTDSLGAANNPDYEDVQDNVNPVVKGVAGFAGDVALDPLTWVPGAAIAKGVNLAGRGLKAAGGVGKDVARAVEAARTQEKAAPGVVEALVDAEKAPAGVSDDLVEAPEGLVVPKAPAGVLDDLLKKEPDPIPASVADQVIANPKSAKIASLLDDLARQRPEKAMPVEAAPAAKAIRMTDSEWLPKFFQEVGDQYNITLPPTSGLPALTINAKQARSVMSRMQKHIAAGGTVADAKFQGASNYGRIVAALKQQHMHYEKAFDRMAEKGLEVNARGQGLGKRPVPAEPVAPVETIVNQLARFQELKALDEERVTAILGSGLVRQLGIQGNPEKFDRIIAELGRILKPTDDLADITSYAGELGPTVKRLFSTLDIDPIATNAARRQAESGVGKTDVTDVIERMRDPNEPLPPAVKQVNDDILAAMPVTVKKDFLDLEAYKLKTEGGTLKTEEGIGVGEARDARAMNTHYQWNNFHRLTDRVTQRVLRRPKALAGEQRSKAVEAEVMPALLKGEELFDQHGLPMYLDFADEKLPISAGQSIEVLLEDSPDLIRQVLFNAETTIPTTNLLDAIFFAVKKDAPAEVVDATLSKVDKRNLRKGEIPNRLIPGGSGEMRYGYVHKVNPAMKMPKAGEGYHYSPKKLNGRVKGWYKVWDADYLRAQLTEAIMRSVPKLKSVAAANAEAYAKRLTDETYDLTTKQVEELTTLVMDPAQLGNALEAMGQVATRIQKDAYTAGTFKESSDVATTLVVESAPELAVGNAKAATTVSKKAQAAGKVTDTKKAKQQVKDIPEGGKATAQKAFNEQADEAENLAKQFDESGPTRDWSDSAAAYREVKAGLIGKLDPMGRFFNYRHGQKNVYDLMNNAGALSGNWIVKRHAAMNNLNKMFGGMVPGTTTPLLRQAFQDVQRGVRSSDPSTAAASDEISRLMGELFDLSGEQPILGNAFFRNNIGLEHLNAMLERNGLGHQFDLDLAARMAKEKDTDLLTEAAGQWRTWQIDDPLDFISRFDSAAIRLFTDFSVGQSFMRRGSKFGWTSTEPKAGYSRIISTDGSAIAAALPKDIYIRDDVLTELKLLEENMYASRQIDGDIGLFVTKYFDPVQSAWKKGITIYRPGHHTRNMVGDESLTFVAEGTKGYMKSAKDAFKVMQLRNEYQGVDLAKALNEMGELNLTQTGDVLSKGHYGDITASGLFDAAERSGLFRSARVIEDYIDEKSLLGGDPKNLVEKASDFLSLHGTAVEKGAMSVSEYREHYVRLKHFIQIIEKEQTAGKKGYKSIEDLVHYAAERVKKYHPDVTMLSVSELRYMRRLIPFYSWFRGVMPAIAESLVLHPGRVNVFPKASYNLAVASGVDPNSLSDPFPTDQLFPGFLTDQVLGPQFEVNGEYFGINPGIAHIDVLNQFATDPLRGAAGMVSPLLRVPAELLAGGSWGTGARIKDDSDYLDSTLPFVNYLGNVTGYSPTGSIASMLGGGGLDPQYQQAAGNKDESDQLMSILNWFTGVGLNDQSKENYINYAEIEKRNKAGEQPRGF